MKAETVEAYLAALAPPRRKALERVRKIINSASSAGGALCGSCPGIRFPAGVIRKIVKAQVERISR